MGRKPLFEAEEVRAAIERFWLQHGMSPTIEELSNELGSGSKRTILRYLKRLEEKGWIERWPGARGMRLLRTTSAETQTSPVPLVGEVRAGPQVISEENIEGWLRMPRALLRDFDGRYFLLRVRGDSMNQAQVAGNRIEDGDLVLVRQQPFAESGSIVVALIDGEATIKRLHKHPDYCILSPVSSTPTHLPILLTEDFRIQGVVTYVLKRGAKVLLSDLDVTHE